MVLEGDLYAVLLYHAKVLIGDCKLVRVVRKSRTFRERTYVVILAEFTMKPYRVSDNIKQSLNLTHD